jgi:hypothetical protein
VYKFRRLWQLEAEVCKTPVCNSCLAAQRQEEIARGAEEAARRAEEAARRAEEAARRAEEAARGAEEAKYIRVGDRIIHCPVCGHDHFGDYAISNIKQGMWFPANVDFRVRVCESCGHALWFIKPGV